MKKTLWIIIGVVFGITIAILVYVKIESFKMQSQYNQISVTHKVIHEKISLKQLSGFLEITEDEMRSRLGNPDQVITTGPDSIYYGYVYNKLGITSIFGEESEKPLYLECSNQVSIQKVKSGMDFNQIKRKLGKSIIQEKQKGTWVLSYQIKGLDLSFASNFKNGKDSKLLVSSKSKQLI